MNTATNFTSTNTSNSSVVKCLITEMPLAPWHLSSINEAAKVSTILAITLNVLIMPLTLFLNALIMFVVWKNPSLQVERVIVLAYLAFTDFLVGLICQPLYIAREILQLEAKEVNCGLETAFFLALGLFKGAEFYQLAVISYERYVAIIHPYEYPTRITVKRLTYATIGLWTFSTVVFLLFFLTLVLDVSLYIDVLTSFSRIVISVCIIYWFTKIFAAIRRQKRQICQQQQSVDINTPHTQKNKKGAITTALLLVCFILSFIPIFVVILVNKIPGLISQDNSVWMSLQQCIESFIFFIAFLNPIIYGLRTKQLKRKCWDVLGFQHENNEVFSQSAFVLQPQTFSVRNDANDVP